MKAVKPIPEWQVQTAKARFSELFQKARTEGPQKITRQGKDALILLPIEQYEKLTKPSKPKESFYEFMRRSPLVGVELDLTRDPDPGRDIDL
ncbi:MAG: type II toxin-antitoxin system prevent-host-death family antitoxin [Bryobacteraceae bacterium]